MYSGEQKVVQTPSWAMWLLGLFSMVALGGGAAWLTNLNNDLTTTKQQVQELRINQAVTSNELTHIRHAVDEIGTNIQQVLKQLEAGERRDENRAAGRDR